MTTSWETQAHFGTLDHFNSVARSVCEQEKVDFSSDGNGNYGIDYGQLDTPVKPILFFDIRKTSGSNCHSFPDFSAKNHDAAIKTCLQNFATIINSCKSSVWFKQDRANRLLKVIRLPTGMISGSKVVVSQKTVWSGP
jgi:hypothetical protein